MQTHEDFSHQNASSLLEQLRKKADRMVSNGESEITAGKEGEIALAEWSHRDFHVTHMPDDEHGVLRISIGGLPEGNARFNYLVFRGKLGDCESLLRKALTAISKYK